MDQDEVIDVVRGIAASAAKEARSSDTSMRSSHKTRVVIEGLSMSMTMTVTKIVITKHDDESSR